MSFTATFAGSVIQDAAHDALVGSAAFMALVGSRLYTDVPQGTPFPLAWLTFGDPMEEPLDSFGRAGGIVHLELHAFSDYEGDDECIDILSQGIEVLHHAALTVSGWSVPLVNRAMGNIGIEDFNGRIVRHGIARIDVFARRDS
jgi:hypothetical protein